MEIAYDAVVEARLVLTDDLIRDALSKDNRARKEARKHRGETDDVPDAGNDNEREP